MAYPNYSDTNLNPLILNYVPDKVTFDQMENDDRIEEDQLYLIPEDDEQIAGTFFAEYGITTWDEVVEAIDSGKNIIAVYNYDNSNYYLPLTSYETNNYILFEIVHAGFGFTIVLFANNEWDNDDYQISGSSSTNLSDTISSSLNASQGTAATPNAVYSALANITATGDVTGSMNTTSWNIATTIADNAITSNKIAANAINNSHIANFSISSVKLENPSINIAGSPVALGGSINASTLATKIVGSNAIGNNSTPVYWNGSAFVETSNIVDEKVKVVALNGENSGYSILMGHSMGASAANTAYASSTLYWNDYGQTLYIGSTTDNYIYLRPTQIVFRQNGPVGNTGILKVSALTASRNYTLPDATGTIALTESPNFSGTPTAPTATAGTNTTQIATTAFVTSALNGASLNIAGSTVALGGEINSITLLSNLGLSTAMHFIGKATVAITDNSTTNPNISGYDFTSDRKPGDVIIDSNSDAEYVWTINGTWEKLGSDSSFKLLQSVVTDPTASGSCSAFIDSISQNAQGVITATKKTVALANNFTVSFNGGTTEGTGKYTFNGSAPKSVNIKAGTGIEIAAAANEITIANAGVLSVKGAAESSYRAGNVSINGANIIGSTAIGGETQPIYWNGSAFVNANINASIINTGILPISRGGTGQNSAANIFTALSWTAGNSSGPNLSVTILGQTRNAAIPAASNTASGVVTTGTQSFQGNKTFYSDEFHIRNSGGNNTQVNNQPYVTELTLGDSRYTRLTEYADDRMAIRGSALILTNQSDAVYNNTATYSVGNVVWYSNNYYRCKTAISTAEEFNASNWSAYATQGVFAANNFSPVITNLYSLGTSSYQWTTVYANSINASYLIGNGASISAINANNISTGILNRPLNYNISTNVTFNATKHDSITSPSAVSYNNTSNQSIDLGYYITATNSSNVGAVTGTTSTTTSSLTISLNGTSQGAWNGSSNKNINITPTAIGAAALASPGFTGVPTAPTAALGTNTTQIATTAFVQAAIQDAIMNAINASY